MATERFTARLSAVEREGLQRLAQQNGTTDNYMVRLAVRHMLGLSVPGRYNLYLPNNWIQTTRSYVQLASEK